MIFPLLSVLAGCDNITTVKIDVGKVRITDKGDDDLSRVTIKCNNGVVIDADWKRNSASISPADPARLSSKISNSSITPKKSSSIGPLTRRKKTSCILPFLTRVTLAPPPIEQLRFLHFCLP